jgi:cell division protein FtsW
VVLMLVGRVRWWHLVVVIPPIMAVGFWFVYHKEYRWRRLMSFTDPFRDPQGEGYHMVQSLLSFASGGVFGKGLGNGVQKLGYLPEDTTDFIFAVVCEELGLFGALLTILLYLGIAFVGWTVIREIKDPLGRLLVFGVTTVVCTQAAINMAVATVSVPTKGMSLPLVSKGGSGLVITCAALGVMYAVARAAERQKEPEELPLRAVAVV